LVEFIGNRTSGLLFKTRYGKQWSQSNILRRHLHPALEEVGFQKAGAHSFRRYRNPFLRNLTDCSESVRDFWLGWGSEGMSALYDQIKANVEFRKKEANRVRVGFDVPASLASIEPIAPTVVSPTVVAVCTTSPVVLYRIATVSDARASHIQCTSPVWTFLC